MIDTLLLKAMPEHIPTKDVSVHIDTVFELYRLARKVVPPSEQTRLLSFLCMRIEIAGRLFCAYGADGKRVTDRLLELHWNEVALAVLFADFLQLCDVAGREPLVFKRLNAMFKLMDSMALQWGVSTDLREPIEIRAQRFLDQYSASATPESATQGGARAPSAEQKILPLTVLFWEGPIARAYLATMKSMGYRPQKIIHLISAVDLVSKKPVGRYLPAFLRRGYAQGRQKNSIHFWPSTLIKKEPALCEAIRLSVAKTLGFSSEVLDNALSLTDLRTYCPNVEPLMVNSLADDRLYNHLAALPETTLLFTGGGIVPARYLQLAPLKFIHVHPGYLPDVRGADCVLWSQLIKGRTSASCFYMGQGIDDGDVIFPCYLPKVEVRFNSSAIPSKMLYRATYAFFDPWVRAYVLREAINATNGFENHKAFEQDESLSTTYHFMHEKIQKVSLDRIFIE